MKLEVKKGDMAVHYTNASWEVDLSKRTLTQYIPDVGLPTPIRPSLSEGQEVRLDGVSYWIECIEQGGLIKYKGEYTECKRIFFFLYHISRFINEADKEYISIEIREIIK